MTITIRAAGRLKNQIASGTTLDDVRTVGEAIERLAIIDAEGVITMVNERVAHWHTELQDGDELQLIPVIGGG